MKISIIVPVYHEEKNIEKTIKNISKKVKTSNEILVIYDSDDDPTLGVLKAIKNTYPSLKIIKNDVGNKKGVINAIKTGISKSKGETILITMADLSDDITQVDQMQDLIKKGFDIVVASRYMKDGKKIGGPPFKTFLSRMAGATLFYIFRIPTHDATNAYKMYNKKIFRRIKIQSTGGFEYSLEIILKAHKLGHSITEIPTVWRDRDNGKSNFKLIKWLPNYIKAYMKALPF